MSSRILLHIAIDNYFHVATGSYILEATEIIHQQKGMF